MAQTTYVFIYLPGQVHPTVAGRFDWEPAVTPHVGEFVYAESYLANGAAVPLDPIALPLRAQVFETTLSSGFFGVFRDAIPDDWGRHVALKLSGTSFQTDFDYLWLHTADRIGALAFGNSTQDPVEERPLLEWEQLQQSELLVAIQSIDRDIPLTQVQEAAALAFGAGTSAGGARPKLSVRRNGDLWLAKLNRHSDRFNVVRVECAMLDLAAACGISVPEHGDFGALAARQNIISSIDAFRLSPREGNSIIDEVQNVVRTNWRKNCIDCGVSDTDVARIEGCFDPPFFESQLPPSTVM